MPPLPVPLTGMAVLPEEVMLIGSKISDVNSFAFCFTVIVKRICNDINDYLTDEPVQQRNILHLKILSPLENEIYF